MLSIKNKSLISVALISSFINLGCTKTSSNTTYRIVDSLGRSVSFNPDEIKKVVCIGAGALRLFTYVGDLKLLSGVEDIERSVEGANPFLEASRPYFDVNKDFFATLPSCGKGGPQNQSPEYEKILSCDPDIIISEYNDKNVIENIENNTKKTVVAVSYGDNSVFDDNVKNSLYNIGVICNTSEKASNLIDYISKSRDELESIGTNNSSSDKFYIGCLGNWGKQSILSTSSNYPLFNVNKLTNAITSTMVVSNGKTNEDSLLQANPTKIILDAAGIRLLKDEYNNSSSSLKSVLDRLDGVKNNQVYLQMPFNVYYTNLEIALMDAYYISSIAYPSAYTNFNIKNKSDEICEKFLGKKYYDEIISKTNSYNGFQNVGSLSEFLSE